jgi:L-ascorbate metabolism protein UlaG (beta-lactamase superfamily)
MKMSWFIIPGLALAVAAGAAFWYIHTPRFGYLPSGDRLKRIEASPNYRDGMFQNLEPAQVMTETEGESQSTLRIWYDFLLGDNSRLRPSETLPFVKTDLKTLDSEGNSLVWMGHSSFYMVLDGWHILVDPVLSDYSSPVPLKNFKAFPGSNIYSAEDMPDRIDLMIISHNHWDHLDYDTQMALKSRVRHIVTPLGIGEDFEKWGFSPSIIHEGDWYDSISLDGLTVHVLTSRHFSGRVGDANKTEWGGFAFITPRHRVYYSGDGGYGSHFRKIGEKFGGFDLAILEDGQYDRQWADIHMMPEEVAMAAQDVGAKAVLPVHNSKFILSRHVWSDPLQRIYEASQGKPYRLLTPKIGEIIHIDDQTETFSPWWKDVK